MADQTKDRGQGFQGMSDDKQREVASKGGKASPRNFKNLKKTNPEELHDIAEKGGES